MRPTLIAECCQNHNGDKDILQRMIHTAAENGADYVKIQAIRSEEVAYRERFEEGIKDKSGEVLAIKRPYQAEVDRLSKLDLDPSTEEWFVQLEVVVQCRQHRTIAAQGHDDIGILSCVLTI